MFPMRQVHMNDEPIRYMERTRDWYLALGYDNPYRWAHFADVPFQRLAQPLAQATVALVTTAAPYLPDKGPQGKGAPFNAAAKFFKVYTGDARLDHDLRNTHVSIDFKHSTREDSGTWFPLPAFRAAAAAGRFRLAPRFYGLPTNRSQRHTSEVDAPELLARCKEDRVDAVVFVPNCPICHQVSGMAARHLEANGIATVVMGCAKDIVEHCGVPRFVFSDFPLGNAAGKPGDPASQAFTLELALATLESAFAPRTTVQSPLRWSESPEWKLDYSNPERASPEELEEARRKMDEGKAVAKSIKTASIPSRP
jgi:D-proline reductase (dithiol) PrdB